MPPSRRKSFVNDKVGAQGLNLFDTSRSIKPYQARVFTNMIPTVGGSKIRFGYNTFNQDLDKEGGIPMLHGFSSIVYTPAQFNGGQGATTTLATWQAITNGGFTYTLDSKEWDITALNFTLITSMDDVAAIIQEGIRLETDGLETVVWDVNHFIISSVEVGGTSYVGGFGPPESGTDISGVGIGLNPMYMDMEHGKPVDKKYNGPKREIIFAHENNYYSLSPDSQITDSWSLIGNYSQKVDNPHAYTSCGYVIFGTGKVGNPSYKYDGYNFTQLKNKASTGGDLSFFEWFQGQDFAALFGAGDPSNPSRLYYSDADNPDDWATGTAGYIDIALNDGYEITGLKAQGDQLIVYKERKKYYLSTFYESDTGVYGIRVQPYVDTSGGSVNHDTIQVLQNADIVALGHKEIGFQGIGKLETADGSLVPKDYSRDIYPLFEQLNYNQIKKARAVVFKKMVFLAVPFGKSATNNNYVFVYHTDSQAWGVIPDINIGSWLVYEDENGDDVLYAGDSEKPIIYKFNENEFTDNGEIIIGTVRTGRINLGSIIDYEDLEVGVFEGSMGETDELKLTFITDKVETNYIIDKKYLVATTEGGGYIANDYIAEEYSTGEEGDTADELRWLAILLIPDTQRKTREIEVQIQNITKGTNYSWNYFSVNNLTFEEAREFPEEHIIPEEAQI